MEKNIIHHTTGDLTVDGGDGLGNLLNNVGLFLIWEYLREWYVYIIMVNNQ